MKKTTFCLMIACLSLTFQPIQSNAVSAATPSSLVITKPSESAKAKALLLRLNEINSMDKSNLESPDKENLRIEVHSIKRQLKQIGGGVYISAGALIIILLLLIILL